MKKRMMFVMVLFLVAVLFPLVASGGKEASSSKTVTIEFYQQKVEAIQIVDELIARFEAQNPGIKVKQTNLPNSETRNVLLMRIAANDVPDILSAYPNAPEFREFVKEGYLYDLSGQDFLKNVNPSVLAPIKQGGKDYSLPISLNTIGVHYNETLFAKYGLSIPTTYEQFIALCEALQSKGVRPLAFSDKDSWTAGIFANCSLGKEMGKAQTDAFFAALAKGKVSAKDNAELRRIAEMVIELRAKFGSSDTAAFGYNDAINAFATGKAAMYINGIWAIPSIVQANPNLAFSMFPIPATLGKETTTIYGIDFAVSMAANTKYPAESLKFLQFLAQPENAQYFSDVDNSPSVITGVKVKSTRIQSLVALLNAGKSFEWNHFVWADGMEGRFNDAVQELAIVRDVDAFLMKLDSIFRD
jgi:raffinose/stachyose/melibiose transport system substrate-binding protein